MAAPIEFDAAPGLPDATTDDGESPAPEAATSQDTGAAMMGSDAGAPAPDGEPPADGRAPVVDGGGTVADSGEDAAVQDASAVPEDANRPGDATVDAAPGAAADASPDGLG